MRPPSSDRPLSSAARAALWQPVREQLAELAASDPRHLRFGARAHRYLLRPPLAPDRVEHLEREAGVSLPADYRDFVLELGDGGAGPALGLWPLDDPRQLATLAGPCLLGDEERAPPAPGTPWGGVVALGQLGCGHVVYLIVSGARRGQVWLDAPTVGVVAPIAAHFIAYYTSWLTALRDGRWPDAHVPPGACALAQGLSGYLGVMERRLGVAQGQLAGEPLRQALSALGPGSIQLITEQSRTAMLPSGTPVAPCLSCEQLLLSLAAQGLDRAAVAAPPAR